MTMAVLAWLVALPLLGVVTGFRTMTPFALLCWFAYRGNLPVDDTWASWTGHRVTAIIFTVLAIGELIADKMPWIPNRTSAGPLAARLGMGGLLGAVVATGLDGDIAEGIFLGLAGTLLGTFGGFLVRRELVERQGFEDWQIAVTEDAITLACSVLALGVVTG
jgi:uncharacterized membrane protein